MKRLLLATSIALAALAPLAPSAYADGIDAKGRDCTEMVSGFGAYSFGATPATRVVTTAIELLAAPCDGITYTLTVSYVTLSGTPVTVTTTTYEAVGTMVQFAVDVPEFDAPLEVHGQVTTAKRDKSYDTTEATIAFDELPGSGGGSYQG
ncbi:MAG: hypothetical protein KY443_06545 [Actinobacteria bacterium]|nr:hypothetical protein [Actinomycetota bacterium]